MQLELKRDRREAEWKELHSVLLRQFLPVTDAGLNEERFLKDFEPKHQGERLA